MTDTPTSIVVKPRNESLPGNHRYQPKGLKPFWGYDNLSRYLGMVEIATMRGMAARGIIPAKDIALLTPEMEERILAITTTEMDKVEKEITKHDIRAWVRIAQEILPPALRRWVHVPLTSYDVIDTARALQFSLGHQHVIKPQLANVIELFANKVDEHAQTLQIGRTHGQHALPITAGFWLATILDRIVDNTHQADHFASALCGKISGAVGAYNAQFGLGIDSLKDTGHNMPFEEEVLDKLGLNSAYISTQIVPPESLNYYLHSLVMLSASFAQFGRDCRHLMRPEIGEIREPFEEGQVGSSTMAHKRNPINFENLEGMFIRTNSEFLKVMLCCVSEHQRDLVGSSVARDYPIIVVNVVQQIETLLRPGKDGKSFLERVTVDKEACLRNFSLTKDVVLAEAFYIALQMAGYEGDAHDLVNSKAMKVVGAQNISLFDAIYLIAEREPEVSRALAQIPSQKLKLLRDPAQYTGISAERARRVSTHARRYLKGLSV